MSFVEIRETIVQMEESKLTEQEVKQILTCVPTSEEADMLSEYTANPSVLGKSEQFLCELMKISRLEHRMNALYFKRRFPDRLDEIKPSIEAVIKATKDLRTNKKLLRLLGVCRCFFKFSTFK